MVKFKGLVEKFSTRLYAKRFPASKPFMVHTKSLHLGLYALTREVWVGIKARGFYRQGKLFFSMSLSQMALVSYPLHTFGWQRSTLIFDSESLEFFPKYIRSKGWSALQTCKGNF